MERVEIEMPLRKDVLNRLDWVAANYFCTTRNELIEMMCSSNDDVSLTAFQGFHRSWLYYGGEEDPNINLESIIAEGIIEAKVWMAQEAICQYLKVRFRAEYQRIQKIVRSINSLSVLIRIMERIFSANQLDEVEAIILSDDVRKEMTIEEMFKADAQEQMLNELREEQNQKLNLDGISNIEGTEKLIKCAIDTLGELIEHELQHKTISHEAANFLIRNFEYELRTKISPTDEIDRGSNPSVRKTIEEIFQADAQERRLNEMREKAELDKLSNIEGVRVEIIQDIICQYLEVHFGAESQHLQDTVRSLHKLDVLRVIIRRIFAVDQLAEAALIIQG